MILFAIIVGAAFATLALGFLIAVASTPPSTGTELPPQRIDPDAWRRSK